MGKLWEFYQIEANCFENTKELEARLYLCAGNQEVLNLILPYVREFNEKLAIRNYQNLKCKKEEFNGKTHNTVVIPALTKGLSWLLNK